MSAMQTAHDVVAAVSASVKTPPGSLRHFARFGAVAVGLVGGLISVSTATANKETALRAAIAQRDNEIAQLKAANAKLENVAAGENAKPSSGDPIQDWVDSLAE